MVTTRSSLRVNAVASAEVKVHVPEAGQITPPFREVNPALVNVNLRFGYTVVLSVPSTITEPIFQVLAINFAFTSSCLESVGVSLPQLESVRIATMTEIIKARVIAEE